MSRRARLVRTAATTAAAVVALTVGGAAPAFAAWGSPGPTDPPPDTGGSTTPTSTSTGGSGDTVSGPTTGQVGDCSVVSSPSYLGLSCGSGSGSHLTVKQILDGDPLPDCWDEPLTDAELAATGLSNQPGPDGQRWYWERCLKGIDPETLHVLPGGIHFTIRLVSIDNGAKVKHLTHNQQQLVDFNSDDQQIPAPVAVTSPSVRPRVGAWVSFIDGTGDTVTASAGGVTLRAQVTGIEVKPLGTSDAAAVSCAGTGYRAEPGDTPATAHPEACWYRYERSSAGQPLVTGDHQPAYPVLITATWGVDVIANGVSTPFNSFTKSQVTAVPVTEIQSIVVS